MLISLSYRLRLLGPRGGVLSFLGVMCPGSEILSLDILNRSLV